MADYSTHFSYGLLGLATRAVERLDILEDHMCEALLDLAIDDVAVSDPQRAPSRAPQPDVSYSEGAGR